MAHLFNNSSQIHSLHMLNIASDKIMVRSKELKDEHAKAGADTATEILECSNQLRGIHEALNLAFQRRDVLPAEKILHGIICGFVVIDAQQRFVERQSLWKLTDIEVGKGHLTLPIYIDLYGNLLKRVRPRIEGQYIEYLPAAEVRVPMTKDRVIEELVKLRQLREGIDAIWT